MAFFADAIAVTSKWEKKKLIMTGHSIYLNVHKKKIKMAKHVLLQKL